MSAPDFTLEVEGASSLQRMVSTSGLLRPKTNLKIVLAS
jgi:hypothetical protein